MENVSISTNKELLDVDLIHRFLNERSYWAKGRSRETVIQTIANSLCFGVYDHTGRQLGFARVVTDYAIFGWLMDVFILENYRGNGLGKFLIKTITEHPDLKTLKKFGLATSDAHGLYEQFGFIQISKPENRMEKLQP